MEIITSLVNNYKESMEGLHTIVKIVVTTVMIFAFIAIVTAIVNVFTGVL